MLALCLKAGKARVLATSILLVALVGFADWSVGPTVSLGVLYILPMMLGAVVLNTFEIAGLAILCALVRARFDVPSSQAEMLLSFAFATTAYFSSGLFVAALVRNRTMVMAHLARLQKEQDLRREAEEQLRVLVESSPAAILTLDGAGVVLAANRAAASLFSIPVGESFQGRAIASYLPVLSDALGLEIGAQTFRTAAQCQGMRENGEIFLAHTWFSSYRTSHGTRLAAIVVDSSEEMRDREEENIRQLMKYNSIAASAVSHEVRNWCSAITLSCTNLSLKHDLGEDEDYQALAGLVQGLEKITSLELRSRELRAGALETVEEIPLRPVLDNLRIMIEQDWREAEGFVLWHLPPDLPTVLADPQGLLQAFLNLAQNSLRAVRDGQTRELRVSVERFEQTAHVRFEDSGPGVNEPENLFQPFQPGADGTGLGLYISRSIVRSYGGDLKFVPHEAGTCFEIELQVV
jgi:two-component system, LuxR family, sensor kinase FixL